MSTCAKHLFQAMNRLADASELTENVAVQSYIKAAMAAIELAEAEIEEPKNYVKTQAA